MHVQLGQSSQEPLGVEYDTFLITSGAPLHTPKRAHNSIVCRIIGISITQASESWLERLDLSISIEVDHGATFNVAVSWLAGSLQRVVLRGFVARRS